MPSLPAAWPLKIALIGDTGVPGPDLDRLSERLKFTDEHISVMLGDMVYPTGPRCGPAGLDASARATLDACLGQPFAGLGGPVWLALGNHDVAHTRRDPSRERCLFEYAAAHDHLVLPALDYAVEREGVTLAVVNTNALTDEAGRMVAEAFGRTKGWRILFGHHVLRTWHDKENEDVLRPWLRRHGIVPHVVANGHAHLLQLGVYDDIVAITSGASARTRRRPECPPDCGPGQIYGSSHKGYGLLSVHTDRIEVVFADLRGRTLHEWSRKGPW